MIDTHCHLFRSYYEDLDNLIVKLKENNITDKKDIQFIKKYIRKQITNKEKLKQPIFINYIFNDAVEVLGYQSWKQ